MFQSQTARKQKRKIKEQWITSDQTKKVTLFKITNNKDMKNLCINLSSDQRKKKSHWNSSTLQSHHAYSSPIRNRSSTGKKKISRFHYYALQWATIESNSMCQCITTQKVLNSFTIKDHKYYNMLLILMNSCIVP